MAGWQNFVDFNMFSMEYAHVFIQSNFDVPDNQLETKTLMSHQKKHKLYPTFIIEQLFYKCYIAMLAYTNFNIFEKYSNVSFSTLLYLRTSINH